MQLLIKKSGKIDENYEREFVYVILGTSFRSERPKKSVLNNNQRVDNGFTY